VFHVRIKMSDSIRSIQCGSERIVPDTGRREEAMPPMNPESYALIEGR
jgi:hypothetical protein